LVFGVRIEARCSVEVVVIALGAFLKEEIFFLSKQVCKFTVGLNKNNWAYYGFVVEGRDAL
jgi:hypothetical protein